MPPIYCMNARRVFGRLLVAVCALVSVQCHTNNAQSGTGSETRFRFKDGNRPAPHFSRNMLALPLDVTGAQLAHDARDHCAARHVVRGSLHLCDVSPSVALEMLQSFHSPFDGRSIFQHAISNYSSVVFPNSQVAGFLDEELVRASPISGADWEFRAEFLSGLDAAAFQHYMQEELPSMLKQDNGLRCVFTNQTAPTRVSNDEAREFSVKVAARLCGGDKSLLSIAMFEHMQTSYPSMISPRTAAQLEANMGDTECEAYHACCCSSPLAVEFVATFSDSVEAAAFEASQELLSPGDGPGKCSTVERVESFQEQSRTTVNMDILLCLHEPVQDFVSELRQGVSPIGEVAALDYIRFHYPSVLSITSASALISTDTVIPQRQRMCADKDGLFCCDSPNTWKLIANFADESEASGFTHYITADLTAHMTAQAELKESENFLFPLSKTISTWSSECRHAVVEEYSPDGILSFVQALPDDEYASDQPWNKLEAGEVRFRDASRIDVSPGDEAGSRSALWDLVTGGKRRR